MVGGVCDIYSIQHHKHNSKVYLESKPTREAVVDRLLDEAAAVAVETVDVVVVCTVQRAVMSGTVVTVRPRSRSSICNIQNNKQRSDCFRQHTNRNCHCRGCCTSRS